MRWQLIPAFLITLVVSQNLHAETGEDYLLEFGHVRVISAHEGAIEQIAFLDPSTLLSVGTRDGKARLWEAVSGELLSEIDTGWSLRDFVVAPDGRYVDVLTRTGAIRRVLMNGRSFTGSETHWDRVGGYGRMAGSPDGSRYATVSRDNDVTVWNPSTRRMHQSYLGTTDYRAVTFLGSNQVFAAADPDKGFAMWDILANEGFGDKRSFSVPVETGGGATAMTYHPLTRQLAISHMDWQLSLWTVGPGLSADFQGMIRMLATPFASWFSPSGQLLFVTAGDNVFAYVTETRKLVKGWQGQSGIALSLAVNSRNDTMAIGTWEGNIVVWRLSR